MEQVPILDFNVLDTFSFIIQNSVAKICKVLYQSKKNAAKENSLNVFLY